MNILDRKLSAMPVGVSVRFTQLNGQIIEGILVDNDGNEALSIQVSKIVTMRYSQITGIEESNSLGAVLQPVKVIPDTVSNSKEETVKKEIYVSCTEDNVKNAYKEMSKDAKKVLASVLNKVQSAIKSHDNSKLTEAVDLSWKLMQINGFESNPEVNAFFAYICVLDKDFEEASKSFYYANDIRNAYCSAYFGAEKEDRTRLFSLASAFASIYIANGNNEYIDEALEVLKISSEKCRDITGIEYIVSNNSYDNDVKVELGDVCRYLGGKCGRVVTDISNLDSCISVIKPGYTSATIIEDIK
ncbi:MAG: hypothetical protein K2K02_10080, partial [Ruminococcus sp.]|nr:hypothetical protein [Ruminococcus sp.]